MARYRLAAPHHLINRLGVPIYAEAGTVIDSSELPSHWEPSPAMMPLDAEAKAAHSEVMQRAIAANGAEITGLGHVRNLPRGRAHLEAREGPRPRRAVRHWWVFAPFSYTTRGGLSRTVDPRSPDFVSAPYRTGNLQFRDWTGGPGNVLDTHEARWDMPEDFTPPASAARPLHDGDAA